MAETGSNVGVPPLSLLKEISGLEFLTRIVDGRLPRPPITETLGFALTEVSPIGTVHGGVAATLLDSCMSCAVQTTMQAGTGYTTLEIKVNMVRPITETTGLIRAEGRSLHTGRRSATAEGKILDANGTLLAHGTTTCNVFPL
jgi:uncharacterized protein (TIGR00369 family)